MNVNHDINNIKLTSAEIADLFTTYIFNSASKCVLTYFDKIIEDPDMKPVIKFALDLTNKITNGAEVIFNSIKHPIPTGFSNNDVNVNGKKLYNDNLILTFTRFMARLGLTNYSEARCSCTRTDVTTFFNDCINSTMKLYDMADEVLLKKGLYIKAPYIPIPEKIDFVEKQSFLNGFFGDKRPYNASEISRLYLNFERNSLYKAFTTGLCQTINTKEIKDYLIRFKGLCEKHMSVVGSELKKSDLPIPMSLDSEVTDSTEAVFSDKLALFYVSGLAELGVAVNGITLARIMRRDLVVTITRLMTEIAQFAEDGINIMIENKWFERIPEAANRKDLLEK